MSVVGCLDDGVGVVRGGGWVLALTSLAEGTVEAGATHEIVPRGIRGWARGRCWILALPRNVSSKPMDVYATILNPEEGVLH